MESAVRKPLTHASGSASGGLRGLSRTGILCAYGVLLFGDAMGAYSIGSVPIQWMTHVGLITIVLLLGLASRLHAVPGSLPILAYVLWAVVTTVFGALLHDYASLMPPLATTAYSVFISLRFASILAFIATTYLVYWLLAEGYRDACVRWTILIATIIALAAIYIYVAQTYGLPELPRTRLGTSGGEQAVKFSYPFHRAIGTFREPSHLAEWLVLPFVLSLVFTRTGISLANISMGLAILLTGSLTGMIGITFGLVAAALVTNRLRPRVPKLFARLVAAVVLSLIAFTGVAVGYGGSDADLFQTISERVKPILVGGLRESNRGYIYEYLENSSMPGFGFGLGNANLDLTQYFNSEAVVSFLSLYFNVAYSAGVPGLILLCLILFPPLIGVLTLKELNGRNRMLAIVAGYLGWLIMFAVSAEEFTMMFGVAFAMLAYEVRARGAMSGRGAA